MTSIIEALALLTPFDIDKRKERIGPPKDGGYVMLPELFRSQTVFSYGIDGEYNFDIEMASRGHTVMMFDHTIDGIHNPQNDPRLRFIKQGVAGTRDDSISVNTIENHLYAFSGDSETDLILKMDVEGYEYEAFDALSEEGLGRFQQIVFEIHSLHQLYDDLFRKRFVRVLEKINRQFTLYHVHANNFDGSDTYTFLSGVPVCNLMELSFARTDLVNRRPSTTLYPTYLDYPCVHPRDKKLWFFPFVPSSLRSEEYARADKYETMQTALKTAQAD